MKNIANNNLKTEENQVIDEAFDEKYLAEIEEAYGQMGSIKPNRWIRKNIFK